ncbi:Protoporphyrinogen oxidase, partial [Ascodesmis nigricans]
GGGISGLATAWYISKFAPHVPITLFEKSSRLGGRVQSKRVQCDDGEILFEAGPRTLRPWSVAGLATLDLVRQLGLEDKLFLVKRDDIASQNRFIFYPDQLNQLPADIVSVFSSLRLPIMKTVFGGLFPEIVRKRRNLNMADESVGSFLSRRVGLPLAESLISAAIHGMYAGDLDQLSMKSLFPKEWRDEHVHGSLSRGLFSTQQVERIDDLVFKAQLKDDNRPLLKKLEGTVMYCFEDGMQTLTDAIAQDLLQRSNVQIFTDSPIEQLSWDGEHIELYPSSPTPPTSHEFFTTPESPPPPKFSHVISTLHAPRTNDLLPATTKIPTLSTIPATSVLVVSLYYRPSKILPVNGFGYLIPKSITAELNPHHALSVTFDTDMYRPTGETGTKLTVTMGGHYWTSLLANGDASFLPASEEEAVMMAVKTLMVQLGGEFFTEEPVAWNVALHEDCYPQYTVGHEERCIKAREELWEKFEGRLSVVGSSYKGVGVSDCVRHAREVAVRLVKLGKGSGLEDVEKTWAVKDTPPSLRRKRIEM